MKKILLGIALLTLVPFVSHAATVPTCTLAETSVVPVSPTTENVTIAWTSTNASHVTLTANNGGTPIYTMAAPSLNGSLTTLFTSGKLIIFTARAQVGVVPSYKDSICVVYFTNGVKHLPSP